MKAIVSRTIASTVALTFVGLTANAGLVSHWAMDETTGQAAADSAGTSPGKLGFSGGVDAGDPAVNQTGQFGTAYTFTSGDSDRVAIANFAPFASLSTGSITGWFNSEATTRGAILNFGEATTADRLIMEALDNGQLNFVIREADTNQTNLRTTAAYNDGQWHHFALVQGGAGTTLFINGAEVAAIDLAVNINSSAWFSTISSPSNMTLGWEIRTNGTFPYDGSLDDLAIFDHALSSQELSNVVNLGASNDAVPEPSSLALLGLGGLLIARRRR